MILVVGLIYTIANVASGAVELERVLYYPRPFLNCLQCLSTTAVTIEKNIYIKNICTGMCLVYCKAMRRDAGDRSDRVTSFLLHMHAVLFKLLQKRTLDFFQKPQSKTFKDE